MTKKELQELVLRYQAEIEDLKGQNTEVRSTLVKLEESLHRLTGLYDFAPVGYFTLDSRGLIQSASITCALMLAVDRDTLSQVSFRSFVQREDLYIFDQHIDSVLRCGTSCRCELRLTKGAGTFFHAQLESSVITDNEGNISEIRNTLSDISDRKRMENKLHQKRAILKGIIDATDFMLVYLDPGFNYVWVNPAYAHECKMKPEKMAGKNLFELFPHPENEAVFRRVRDTGEPVFFKDMFYEYPDQPERGVTYWDWSLVPDKNESGEIIGLVYSLRETTKSKQAEIELAESEERFRRIAETSMDIIFQLDPEGSVTYCSPAVRILGYSSGQVIGRSFARFVPENELPKVHEALQQVKLSESISLFEAKLLKADGSIADCEISVTPVIKFDKLIGVQGIARDITERKSAETAVRRSEAQLQTVFNNMTEGLVAADLEGNLIQWNPAAIKIHGFTSEAEYLRNLPDFRDTFELFTDEDGVLPFEQWPMVRILRGETLQNREVSVRRLDIDWQRTLSYNGTLARNNEGEPLLAILTLNDITDRKWVEKQLIRTKKEWELTFDSVPDLIAILDNQHRIIRVNKAMADRMGMSPGQCITRKCFTCVHGENEPPSDCPHTLTMRDGKEHRAEVYEKRMGGYFLVTTTPLFDEKNNIIATVHVARDITDRKRAEKLLLASEHRFKSAEKMAHLGSWQLDLVNNVLTWSDEVYRIFGLHPQQFNPCYEDFLAAVHPDDREKVEKAYKKSLESGSDFYEVEHRIVRRTSGEVRHVLEKCENIRDSSGRVVTSVGMVHDITERKLADERIRTLNLDLRKSVDLLEEANRELERSNRDLEQFVNVASHDLQEPLRTVSSFMQLLRKRYDGKLDDKADTFINFAVDGANHMQKMINDLLAFSRVGGGELRLRPITLHSVIENLLFSLKTTIEENQVEITVDRLPVVYADEAQIGHLLQNLIINAIKFRGDDKPRIHIFAENKQDETVVCVRDNGIGIEQQHADQIFFIFQRLHRRGEYTGTGIGLAICKKIVERHGGRIWVESAPGQGASFCFTLPEIRGNGHE